MRAFSRLKISKNCSRWPRKAIMKPEFPFTPCSKRSLMCSRNIMSTSWSTKFYKAKPIWPWTKTSIFFTNYQSSQTIFPPQKLWNSFKNWSWATIFLKKSTTMRSRNTQIWSQKTIKWNPIENKSWKICSLKWKHMTSEKSPKSSNTFSKESVSENGDEKT